MTLDRAALAAALIEGHDVAWWRDEARRAEGRVATAVDEATRLTREHSAFRVRASAEAERIIACAQSLRIRG